ncbi:MAG TPA: type II secretion system protein [Thermoanaerobaculia bacterium]|nr:type II secretion system protein [Thermoanaerobaculia bacterium]
MDRRRQQGMTLAEVLVAVALVSSMVFATLTVTVTAITASKNNISKEFATQKAISMLDELKTVVQTDNGGTLKTLDQYDDGTDTSAVLTTQNQLEKLAADRPLPDDPISGNSALPGGKWLYVRRVSVQKMPGLSNDVRLVNVKVFKNEDDRQRLVAEVASVIRTLDKAMPPSQVYDVYCIAIENVPGWWVYMSNIVPFVRSSITDLESRNPGLVFRQHWITALSYGRDQEYRPFINRINDSTATIDNVYFYPGKMPSVYSNDTATKLGDDYYYPDTFFRGRMSTDDPVEPEINGYDGNSTTLGLPNPKYNPWPYALADQYNHAMRYQDEVELYTKRKAANPNEEMTLRLLLDDMYMNPDNYTNAIVVNLHGELLPFPPIRNYSDAAKDPETTQNVRVVTHPEQLRYDNAQDINLRVYSYLTTPSSGDDYLGKSISGGMPITVRIKGLKASWSPVAADVQAITGNATANYAKGNASTTSSATAMYYGFSAGATETVFHLWNSPLKHPCRRTNCTNGGLDPTDRLYNMEYIPAPVENLTVAGQVPFSVDLTDTSTKRPRNTARWIIRIPKDYLPTNAVVTVETSIGIDAGGYESGTMWPPFDPSNDDSHYKPTNMSRTYTWIGDDDWIFGNTATTPPKQAHLPVSERYQMLGDPRHLPYADLKRPHVSSPTVFKDASGNSIESKLGMGYNRYFDDFHDAAAQAYPDWPGWFYKTTIGTVTTTFGVKNDGTSGDALSDDGWLTTDPWTNPAGFLDIDMNRMYQVFRSSLIRANAIYTSMTGFSYYYVGIGNEIGYDNANAFKYSVPVNKKPYNGTTTGDVKEQTIISNINGTTCSTYGIDCGTKYIKENGGSGWWGLPWLGELYPDVEYTSGSKWATNGNLKTGSGANTYVRDTRNDLPTASGGRYAQPGTSLINTIRRTSLNGSTAFLWSGTKAATFLHKYADSTNGTLQNPGKDVRDNYKFPLPDDIPNARPFSIAGNITSFYGTGTFAALPDDFLENGYPIATKTSVLRQFYLHQGDSIEGSSLLSWKDGATNEPAFVVINGLSPQGQSGTALIAKWAFLSVVESYLSGGLYTDTSRSPNDLYHVRQLPRISVTKPDDKTNLNNPSNIPVAWNVEWKRWDGLKYTTAYPGPNNYTGETMTIKYALLYSRDNGKSWLYIKDDSPARIGVKPSSTYEMTATSLSPNWDVSDPGKFGEGTYIIRVEAYREGFPQHYAFHQYRFFLRR